MHEVEYRSLRYSQSIGFLTTLDVSGRVLKCLDACTVRLSCSVVRNTFPGPNASLSNSNWETSKLRAFIKGDGRSLTFLLISG